MSLNLDFGFANTWFAQLWPKPSGFDASPDGTRMQVLNVCIFSAWNMLSDFWSYRKHTGKTDLFQRACMLSPDGRPLTFFI